MVMIDHPHRTAISAEMTDARVCEHCWHGTGRVMLTYPAQSPQVCCQCGEKRTVRLSIMDATKHGPYAPKGVR